MTPDEAERRIALSRQTLSRYIDMTESGVDPMPGTLLLVQDEIALLESMGEEHPGKIAKLILLASEWVAFRERLKSRLN